MTRQQSVPRIIFNLQNTFGWKHKTEVGLDRETRKCAVSYQEKLAMLRMDDPESGDEDEMDEG